MSEIRNVTHIDNVRLSDDGSSVIILDQSRLPMHTEYIEINKPAEMYDAIFHLKVRGAPAIGIFAAYSAWRLLQRRQPVGRQTVKVQQKEMCSFLQKN